VLIVLTGIDGAGKTTAARALVDAAADAGAPAVLLRNHAGRRQMALWSDRLNVSLPPRLADAVETAIRIGNVLASTARAGRTGGLVVMDRHLYCQLALRRVRGLPRGRLLPFLLRVLPQPDLIAHFDVEPEQAHLRVLRRGTDVETVAELRAFRNAYRELPEYGQFQRIDAGGPAADVLARLVRAVDQASGLLPAGA
jgi:dTMP kinase